MSGGSTALSGPCLVIPWVVGNTLQPELQHLGAGRNFLLRWAWGASPRNAPGWTLWGWNEVLSAAWKMLGAIAPHFRVPRVSAFPSPCISLPISEADKDGEAAGGVRVQGAAPAPG